MWQVETSRNPISTLPTMLRLNFQCWEGEKKNSPPIGVVYSQLTSKSEVGNLTTLSKAVLIMDSPSYIRQITNKLCQRPNRLFLIPNISNTDKPTIDDQLPLGNLILCCSTMQWTPPCKYCSTGCCLLTDQLEVAG